MVRNPSELRSFILEGRHAPGSRAMDVERIALAYDPSLALLSGRQSVKMLPPPARGA